MLNAINNYNLPQDYPALHEQALRVEDKLKVGFGATKAELELIQVMNELWLARANKPKR